MGDYNTETSDFNMAIAFLMTLRHLLNICVQSSSTLDTYNWFHALMALHRELADDMSPEEFERSKTYATTIQPQVEKFASQRRQSGGLPIPPQLYQQLNDFEISLRKIISKKGYKTKMSGDAMKALQA